MKTLGKDKAFVQLRRSKDDFRHTIVESYEHKAKSCDSCETFGACCTDAHFVNVHITELEAEAICRTIDNLPSIRRAAVRIRIDEAIEDFGLSSEGDTLARTFACPLFERTSGCLVHFEGKPLACINHACYERKEDLPPDELLEAAEAKLGRLNARVFRRPATWLPLPVAIRNAMETTPSKSSIAATER